MIGAVGEIVGAGAVVLTLGYLARQIRDGAREAQRNRWSALNHEITRTADSWAGDTEVADVVFRGLTDPESLQPHEAFRLYSSLHRFFRAWEAAFEYSREGGLHQWGAESVTAMMTDFMGLPGAQAYWRNRRRWFSSAFQAEVDSRLGKAPALGQGEAARLYLRGLTRVASEVGE
jgi:hypothetical protein